MNLTIEKEEKDIRQCNDTEGIERFRSFMASAGGMKYVTKEIFSGSHLEVAVYPDFESGGTKKSHTQKKKTAQQNKITNLIKAKKECKRLIFSNFSKDDHYITLTFRPSSLPRSLQEASSMMRNFFRRVNYDLKKKGAPSAKYIYVIEGGEGSEIRFHYHMITDTPIALIRKHWIYGIFRYDTLDTRCGRIDDLSNYFLKQERAKYEKKWYSSQNLQKSEVVKSRKITNRQMWHMERNHNAVEDCIKELYAYDGYQMTEFELKENKVNHYYYLSVELNKNK